MPYVIRPGTHGVLKYMCFDGRKRIVGAPLFIDHVTAHVVFLKIGSVLFPCTILKGVTVLPTLLIQRE